MELTVDSLYFRILDDGKGILNQNAFGNGLKNIKKRIEEINGEVTFAANNGTCVTIQVFTNNALKVVDNSFK